MWQRIDIAGKPAHVLDPPDGARPRFAILHLHGISGKTLAEDATFTRALTQLGLPCVCPHGQRSWWADRICTEFDANLTAEQHVLHNVVQFMQARWSLEARRIGLTGISMGGQG